MVSTSLREVTTTVADPCRRLTQVFEMPDNRDMFSVIAFTQDEHVMPLMESDTVNGPATVSSSAMRWKDKPERGRLELSAF